MGANVPGDNLVRQLPVELSDEMAAFDLLPPSVRRKLAEGPYSLAALSVIAHWRRAGGTLDEQGLLEALEEQFEAMVELRGRQDI